MYVCALLCLDTDLYILCPAGVVQGMITGIRGLCNGLGPALYGFVFYLFHVELTDTDPSEKGAKSNMANPTDEVNKMRPNLNNVRVYLYFNEVFVPLVPSECHHPRPSLSVWRMLGAAVLAGGPVYPRAHGAWHETRCL